MPQYRRHEPFYSNVSYTDGVTPPTPYNPNPATALIQCTVTMTIPIVERAGAFTTRRAIVATEGTFTYGDLLGVSERAAVGAA